MTEFRRIVSALAAMFLIITTTGCPDAQSGAGGKDANRNVPGVLGTPGTPATPGAAAPAGFDPRNFEASLRWIALQAQSVHDAEQKNNKLLVDDRVEAMKVNFARLAGQKIDWQVHVEGVTDTRVLFKDYHLGEALEPTDWGLYNYLIIFGSADQAPPAVLSPNGNWTRFGSRSVDDDRFQPGLEIGKVISKDKAKKLAKGDKLRITGKIAFCAGSAARDGGSGSGRMYVLYLVEAAAPD